MADVWELRLLFDPTRMLIVKEGDVLSLPPGSVGTIVEAVYGDRTSFLDVTATVAAAVDEEKQSLENFSISNMYALPVIEPSHGQSVGSLDGVGQPSHVT